MSVGWSVCLQNNFSCYIALSKTACIDPIGYIDPISPNMSVIELIGGGLSVLFLLAHFKLLDGSDF